MHSTRDPTLQLIQREINDVVQREKELKQIYSQVGTNKITNGIPRTSITNGIGDSPKNSRVFIQNPSIKGAMQRFIKSRGKVSNVLPTHGHTPKPPSWTSPETVDLDKPVVPVGIRPRNGFIPIKERLRKEFIEMEERETELIKQRTKSHPDLLALLNSHSPELQIPSPSTRSLSRLSDSTCDNSSCSPPSSLKPARSLADLCALEDEEPVPLGSVNLIKRWEGIIQKNQNS